MQHAPTLRLIAVLALLLALAAAASCRVSAACQQCGRAECSNLAGPKDRAERRGHRLLAGVAMLLLALYRLRTAEQTSAGIS